MLWVQLCKPCSSSLPTMARSLRYCIDFFNTYKKLQLRNREECECANEHAQSICNPVLIVQKQQKPPPLKKDLSWALCIICEPNEG